jgi:hypothetical protein
MLEIQLYVDDKLKELDGVRTSATAHARRQRREPSPSPLATAVRASGMRIAAVVEAWGPAPSHPEEWPQR